MDEHYFTENPQSGSKPVRFTAMLGGIKFTFQTDAGVFAKTKIDFGTRLLIDSLPIQAGQWVLDVGCGYGPIGIAAAKMVSAEGFVHLIDVNERAVALAKINLALNKITNARAWQSRGFEGVDHVYDWILTNPPIRAGKKVIYPLIEKSLAYCKPGGSLMLVVQTRQGAKSMEEKMRQVYNNVQVVTIKGGYRVLQSIRL